MVFDTEQKITVSINHQSLNQEIFMTAVYAKCTKEERVDPWAQFTDISQIYFPNLI